MSNTAKAPPSLPADHPAQAYLDDARALLDLIRDDPSILDAADLDFLNEFSRSAGSSPDAGGVGNGLEAERVEMELKGTEEGMEGIEQHEEETGGGACTDRKDGQNDSDMMVEMDGRDEHQQQDQESDEEEEEEEEEDESYWEDDDASPYEYVDTIAVKRSPATVTPNDTGAETDGPDEIETYETILIGSGPSGIGTALALLTGGHRRSSLLVLEQNVVGSTFDQWHVDTRFISPSWNSGGWGQVDLNGVEPDKGGGNGVAAFCAADDDEKVTAAGSTTDTNNDGNNNDDSQQQQLTAGLDADFGSQHPSGRQYARYLRHVASKHRIPIREHARVVSIERIPGTKAWAAGGYEIQFDCHNDGGGERCEGMTTTKRRTVYSRFVVWCGGEWGTPNMPPVGHDFEEDASVHYAKLGRSEEEWRELVERARSNPVPIDNEGNKKTASHAVIIGAYEAGVDAACGLLKRGVQHVTLVDTEDRIEGWPDVGRTQTSDGTGNSRPRSVVDPSVALSPMSSFRLRQAMCSGRLSLLPSHKCIGTTTKDAIYWARLEPVKNEDVVDASSVASDMPTTHALASSIPIIFCTGFAPSKNGVTSNLVKWNSSGSPLVSKDCDESTISPGFFICGPMLRHWVKSFPSKGGAICSSTGSSTDILGGSCHANLAAAGEEKSSKDMAKGGAANDEREEVEIIFCFIYKFRTRFALVAGEILSRLVYDTHTKTTEHDGLIIDKVGTERLDRLEQMLALYKERGMLTDSLDCSLSCSER